MAVVPCKIWAVNHRVVRADRLHQQKNNQSRGEISQVLCSKNTKRLHFNTSFCFFLCILSILEFNELRLNERKQLWRRSQEFDQCANKPGPSEDVSWTRSKDRSRIFSPVGALWDPTPGFSFHPLTTDRDVLGVGSGHVDDVGHLFQQLFSFVQQLQDVASMKSLKEKNAQKLKSKLGDQSLKHKTSHLLPGVL